MRSGGPLDDLRVVKRYCFCSPTHFLPSVGTTAPARGAQAKAEGGRVCGETACTMRERAPEAGSPNLPARPRHSTGLAEVRARVPQQQDKRRQHSAPYASPHSTLRHGTRALNSTVEQKRQPSRRGRISGRVSAGSPGGCDVTGEEVGPRRVHIA